MQKDGRGRLDRNTVEKARDLELGWLCQLMHSRQSRQLRRSVLLEGLVLASACRAQGGP